MVTDWIGDMNRCTGPAAQHTETFFFPQHNSALHSMFDAQALIAWRHLPGFRAARQTAFEYFEKHPDDREPRAYLILRMNGEVALWRFGPRGAHKRLWNFGDPLQPKEPRP